MHPTLGLACVAAQADDDGVQGLLDTLQVDVIPSVQFWRAGKKLWEHKGILSLEQDLGEGGCQNWVGDVCRHWCRGPGRRAGSASGWVLCHWSKGASV